MEQFIPEVIPPTSPLTAARCFAFCADDLLVHASTGQVDVPTRELLAQAEIKGEREFYLGSDRHYGPCFAVELGADYTPPDGFQLHGLRDLASPLGDLLFAIGGRAVQIINWARTHRYCGRCGTETQSAPTERAQVCPACGLTAFPRLSPAIIVRIRRGDQILLARNHRFPPGRFSILAGFVEPGETLEEAVVREVREEVGIQVRNIQYVSSQPWPFPNSLMLGFTAEYAEGELDVDGDELVEAHWFSPDDLPDLPPTISIARKMIDQFLESVA